MTDDANEKAPDEASESLSDVPEHKRMLLITDFYLSDLDCLREMFETVKPVLAKQDEERAEKLKILLESAKSSGSNDSEDKEELKFTSDEYREFLSNLQKLRRAEHLFHQQLIVSLISRFDEFLGEFLKIVLHLHPEWLKTSEKTLTYKELIEMKSVEKAISGVISKEIDNLLRGSHEEQIDFIDDKLKIGIKDHFEELPSFLEIAERRNLIAHTGGKVSQQYLDRCKCFGYTHKSPPEIDSLLNIDGDYFLGSFCLCFEIGLRVSQASYRRLFPDELKDADRSLNNLTIKFLDSGEWELAERVCNFNLSIPDKLRSSDDHEFKYYALINRAIAQKNLEKDIEPGLLGVPWAAFHPKYSMALHILRDDYDSAKKLMATPSVEEEVTQHGFRTWPLFRNFRESTQFKEAYQELYGEEYILDPEKDKSVDDEPLPEPETEPEPAS